MNTQSFGGLQSQNGFSQDGFLDYFQTQQQQSQTPSYAEFPALGQFSQVRLGGFGRAACFPLHADLSG